MKHIDYVFRGTVERPHNVRGKQVGFQHVEGYSERGPNGGALYPWMTRRECLADAKRQDGKAHFHRADYSGSLDAMADVSASKRALVRRKLCEVVTSDHHAEFLALVDAYAESEFERGEQEGIKAARST